MSATQQQQQQKLAFPPPPSLHSDFVMQPASLSQDLDQMTELYYTAFADHPGNTYWWAPTREKQERWLRARVTSKFADPAVRHYKIVHVASGDVAAWARWDIPEGAAGFGVASVTVNDDNMSARVVDEAESRGEAKRQALTAAETPSTTTTTAAEGEQQQQKKKKKGLEPPEGGNAEWFNAFFGSLVEMHDKWDAGKMLGLSLIATAPAYQRRGAARALIEPLLAVADAQGLATYLEATVAGRPVYEKLGFREVDVIDFDIREITGGKVDVGSYPLSVMVREPVGGRR